MNFIVVRYGDIVGQNLTKSQAVELALRGNGFRHHIKHDGNDRHYLWLSTIPAEIPLKTLIYSSANKPAQIAEEIYEKLYDKRQSLNLQIYTPEEYERAYRTLIF